MIIFVKNRDYDIFYFIIFYINSLVFFMLNVIIPAFWIETVRGLIYLVVGFPSMYWLVLPRFNRMTYMGNLKEIICASMLNFDKWVFANAVMCSFCQKLFNDSMNFLCLYKCILKIVPCKIFSWCKLVEHVKYIFFYW